MSQLWLCSASREIPLGRWRRRVSFCQILPEKLPFLDGRIQRGPSDTEDVQSRLDGIGRFDEAEGARIGRPFLAVYFGFMRFQGTLHVAGWHVAIGLSDFD